jgi:hypothetical protein
MTRVCYVYEVTEIETGKWYVGSRIALKVKSFDIGVSYFTSSRVVKPLYKRNPHNFTASVLAVGDEAFVLKTESKILKERDARNDPMSFNMSNGDAKFNGVKSGLANAASGRLKTIARLGGLAAVASGQLQAIRSAENSRKAGLQNVESGHLLRIASSGGLASVKSGHLLRIASLGGKAGGKKGGQRTHELGHLAKICAAGGLVGGKVTAALRYRCDVCGMVSVPGALGRHLKASGHIGKTRLDKKGAGQAFADAALIALHGAA